MDVIQQRAVEDSCEHFNESLGPVKETAEWLKFRRSTVYESSIELCTLFVH
jgi:hypothetical protein